MQATTADRLNPPPWDHHRHSLVLLRREIEQLIARHRLGGEGRVIADFGAGDAPYRPLFEATGARYVTCDLGDAAEVPVIPGEPLALPDASVDGVVSFQVLEHVWDLDWYIGECRRILRPGGWLLLSTHGVWLYHPHPTDFRRWTRDGLREELATRGLRVESLTGLLGPLAWMTNFYLLAAWAGLRGRRAGRALYVPLGLLGNAVMAAQDRITPPQVREENASLYVTFSRLAA